MRRLVNMWGRRFLSIPLYLTLWVVVCGLLPLLLPLTAAVDVWRRRPYPLARAILFFAAYLCCEVAGILASLAVWLMRVVGFGGGQRYLRWNYNLERAWARALMGAAKKIFGMSIVVEADIPPTRGPLLVLIRHVSIGDTLLPSLLLSDRFEVDLRYVLKKELLWDPCLDIVGNRLPNHFARRGSGESAREIAAVQALMEDLKPGEGVLIYPEGTRFTVSKRTAILEKLGGGKDRQAYERASRLKNVLPPRLGGVLGLLERNRNADVVFVAHTGFEGTMNFAALLNGALIGRIVRVGMWQVSWREVPETREARIDWLYEQWRRMDSWVSDHSK